MTTHYMDEALALCSRFGILRAGRLIACGSLDELRASSGKAAATLDELFTFYTGEAAEVAGAYNETSGARRIGQRLS